MKGEIERLPNSLIASVQAFEGDSVLCEALGKNLAKTIIAIRKVRIISWLVIFESLLFWLGV